MGSDRADALEAAASDNLTKGYEMTGHEAFAVYLKEPRRFRLLRFVVLAPLCYLALAWFTDPALAGFLVVGVMIVDVVWELVFRPVRTIRLWVDDAGQVYAEKWSGPASWGLF